jgi:hypothetical protein
MDMNLTLSNNTLSGNLMGTPVYGMTRSALGGASPPAGLYNISPPVSDPMFGVYAVLTPVTGGSSSLASTGKHFDRKLFDPVNFDHKHFFPKLQIPKGPGTLSQVLVLSDRVIPGRNCIVMSLGFADMMSALQSAGGGQITIA